MCMCVYFYINVLICTVCAYKVFGGNNILGAKMEG